MLVTTAQVPAADTTSTPAIHGQAVSDAPPQNAPGVSGWGALGAPAWQAPGRDSRPDADRMVAGLPLRTPGANMIPGSARDKTAASSAMGKAPASGRAAVSTETEQGTASDQPALPRRSPELARARLSGFQLGGRNAEAQSPSSGEVASH